MNDVDLDGAAIADMLNSVDGPVGQMLQELSAQAATVARNTVHIRHGKGGRTARAPGVTLASISVHIGYDSLGLIYGGVNAVADPTIYLEDPARQMHGRYPFLTTGLWSLEGGF